VKYYRMDCKDQNGNGPIYIYFSAKNDAAAAAKARKAACVLNEWGLFDLANGKDTLVTTSHFGGRTLTGGA